MNLKDLSITISRREKAIFKGFGSECVIRTLYLICLDENYETNCKKVVVYITENPKIYTNKIANLIDYIEVYEHFDFGKFNGLGTYEQKLMMLDTLQSALLRTAKEFGWETKELSDAYNCCIERKLVCEWYRKREKYFLSPDKKYYARIFGSMDSDLVEYFIVFYNKKKEEVKRVKIFEEGPCLYDKQDIGEAGWLKDQDLTFRTKHRFMKNVYFDAILE